MIALVRVTGFIIALQFLSACEYKIETKGDRAKISVQAGNKPAELSCKLSSPEIRERKETVLASLKNQIIERKELENGYAFKFKGDDKVFDELHEFIKTERQCCDFFVFNLSISGDKSEIWLELTGVEGAKEFIDNELAM